MPSQTFLKGGLVVLVAIALIAVVGPVDATGCARPVPTDLHSDDGEWLILYGHGCTEGTVFTHNKQWGETDRTHVESQINTSGGYHPKFRVFAPAQDDGWWFVSERGRAYMFSSNFNYTNRTRTLPFYRDRFDWEEYLTGFTIDNEGRWWITTNKKTLVIDSSRNETVRTFRKGADDIVIDNNRVLILRSGQKGGVVREYVTRKDSNGRPTLREREKHELGPEVFHPALLSRGADGKWWIYSSYESAFAYDENWRYAGKRYQSYSMSSGIFFLSPVLFISVAGFWIVSWRAMMDYTPRRVFTIYFLSVSLSVPLALSLRDSLVPSPLIFLYWPPDGLVAGLLLIPAAIGLYLLENRSWAHIALVVAANLPLLVVSWDFLTSAG